MNHGPEVTKWMELRAKTDRQLAVLLNRTLAGGVRLALESARTEAPDLYAQAWQAYEQVRHLLPCLNDIAVAERRRLQRELDRLGCLLSESSMAEASAGAA